MNLAHEDNDGNLESLGAIRSIVLPLLPFGVKFTIMSIMLQMLNLKGLFSEAASKDANQHLMNFIAICKSSEVPGVSQAAICLHLFPLSHYGEAIKWLNKLLHDSITYWRELRKVFLERFFTPSRKLQLKDEINTHNK